MSQLPPTKADYVRAIRTKQKCVRVSGTKKQLIARVTNLAGKGHERTRQRYMQPSTKAMKNRTEMTIQMKKLNRAKKQLA